MLLWTEARNILFLWVGGVVLSVVDILYSRCSSCRLSPTAEGVNEKRVIRLTARSE